MNSRGGCLGRCLSRPLSIPTLPHCLWKGLPKTTRETKGLALLPVASLCKWSVILPFEVWQPTFISDFVYKQGPCILFRPCYLGLTLILKDHMFCFYCAGVLETECSLKRSQRVSITCSFPFLDFQLIYPQEPTCKQEEFSLGTVSILLIITPNTCLKLL